METNDRQRFAEMLVAVAEIHGKSLSAAGITLYWNALEQYHIRDVQRALNALLRTSPYMPKPADVIAHIDGTGEDKAMAAWTAVLQTGIKRVGSYGSVVFDDPIVHAVIDDMGGWCKVCELREDSTPFVAREFQARYSAYERRPPATWPSVLRGVVDLHNSAAGHVEHVPDPVVIGDPERARLTIEGGSATRPALTRLSDIAGNIKQLGAGAA